MLHFYRTFSEMKSLHFILPCCNKTHISISLTICVLAILYFLFVYSTINMYTYRYDVIIKVGIVCDFRCDFFHHCCHSCFWFIIVESVLLNMALTTLLMIFMRNIAREYIYFYWCRDHEWSSYCVVCNKEHSFRIYTCIFTFINGIYW